VVLSSWGVETRLGVPHWWSWLLTGLQVTALWAAGSKRWWGWLLGAAVQPPWIVYALLTDQLGFVPGCAVSAAVQTYSFLYGPSRRALLTRPRRRHDQHRTARSACCRCTSNTAASAAVQEYSGPANRCLCFIRP